VWSIGTPQCSPHRAFTQARTAFDATEASEIAGSISDVRCAR
jgi:hypothetical protein